MSLLYYMFQSILNTFSFGYFFGGKKLIIFAENSAKIINLIFEPFPKPLEDLNLKTWVRGYLLFTSLLFTVKDATFLVWYTHENITEHREY